MGGGGGTGAVWHSGRKMQSIGLVAAEAPSAVASIAVKLTADASSADKTLFLFDICWFPRCRVVAP